MSGVSPLVEFEIEQGIATITLNRPEKLNAFTPEMLDDWLASLEACRVDPEVRVIVMTGRGRAFTTGGDVDGFAATASLSREEIRSRLVNGIQRLPRKMAQIDKPIIAALNGLATGGGLDIALACDIRFAAETARFAETYARMGLIPGAGGAYLLPRLVGMAKALEMLWSCDWVEAREAERMGLINKVFADEELQAATRAFARRLADGAPMAIQWIKRMARQSASRDLDGALDIAASALPIVRTSEDHLEAVEAFRQKRLPKFKGR